MSIFKEYFSEQAFEDRFLKNETEGIDVIIPVYHTNELWHANLLSIYREVPVKRLLISDGGVIDDSLDIVKKFPRVEVFNHRHYKTLGKCIAELIKEVTSEWFIYFHSDVYLPPGWFANMTKYKGEFDWYGCPMHVTVLVNYKLKEPLRPYAGSQIGRKAAFENGINKVEDDFVYRQEDFVFNRIVEDAGFKTGKVEDTFHYHQLMYRKSAGLDLNIKAVHVDMVVNEKEKKRSAEMQIRGIVKYLDPIETFVINDFKVHLKEMLENNALDFLEFKKWVKFTNVRWLPYLSTKVYLRHKFRNIYYRIKYIKL